MTGPPELLHHHGRLTPASVRLSCGGGGVRREPGAEGSLPGPHRSDESSDVGVVEGEAEELASAPQEVTPLPPGTAAKGGGGGGLHMSKAVITWQGRDSQPPTVSKNLTFNPPHPPPPYRLAGT